jgi:uncharacterized protein YjbI with pentapeptide repeats
MANPNHVEIVRQGKDAIAEWNTSNGGNWLDLNGADLSYADLNQADLTIAVCEGANLVGADLSEAILDGTNLRRANLTEADLTSVNLCVTDLSYANLSRAILKRANFRSAILSWTTLVDVDLSETTGLDRAVHEGPSALGGETLIRSQVRIHDSFLRGCGIPDSIVTDLSTVPPPPIRFYCAFVSFSHQEEEFAAFLTAKLRQAGVQVWFAQDHIVGGADLSEQIKRGIKICDRLIIVLSALSMTSDWVRFEIEQACRYEKEENRTKLFPVRLVDNREIDRWRPMAQNGDPDLVDAVRRFYIPDFSNWRDHDSFEREFGKLLNGLKLPPEIHR